MDHGINEQLMEARKMAAMGVTSAGQYIGSQIGFGQAVYQNRPKETTIGDALYRAVAAFDELEKRTVVLVDRMCGEANEASALNGSGQAPGRGGVLGSLTDTAETLERRIHRVDNALRRLESSLPAA